MVHRISDNDGKIEIRNNPHSVNILYHINKIREELEEIDFLDSGMKSLANGSLDSLESTLTR